MNTLHAKLIDPIKFEPKEGQYDDLACSNKKSITYCPSFGTQNIEEQTEDCFSEEELENISDLGSVLRGIRNRILSDGYSIEDLRSKLYSRDYNFN